MMRQGLHELSQREREALRLLLQGHDAKSIARTLSLSVHTINERLREARRKLGVSSSREAARLLALAEQQDPYSVGDKAFGVAAASQVLEQEPREGRRPWHPNLLWLAGGMLIMSIIVATVVLSSTLLGAGSAAAPVSGSALAAAQTQSVAETAGSKAARQWVALVDAQNWSGSWAAAGTMFQSQVTEAQWASTIEAVRPPLGRASSRVLQSVTETTSLPNAPAGRYQVVEFKTQFAQKPGVVETVFLALQKGEWKVVGYFIR